jgi:hypothetical protein
MFATLSASSFHTGKIVYKYYIPNQTSEQFISSWQQRINSQAVHRPVLQYHAATLAWREEKTHIE